jgi:hypothetical protein
MLRGSTRPDALVLLTLFPPKATAGQPRGWSTYYLTNVGQVAASNPLLVERITADLWRLPGHSLGLVVNEPLPQPADWRPNTGNGANWGASNGHIGPCRWVFAECDRDDLTPAQQLELACAVFGAEPTFTVHTGGKSLHSYAKLGVAISAEQFAVLQRLVIAAYERLAPGCRVDPSLAKPAQVLRVAGGQHRRTGRMASIHTASANWFDVEVLEARLRALVPIPPPVVSRWAPSPRTRPWSGQAPTLEDIADALAVYPRRQAGYGGYAEHRNLLWGLVKACEEAGGSIETAIALMEAHSPSSECGWDVRQVARSGGRDAHPGWFWALAGGHPAKRQGVRL